MNILKTDIARRIRRSIPCVTTYLTQGNSYGQNYQGRRPALSLRETRRLIQTVKKSNSSSTKLKADLGINASTRTIQHTLKKKGFNWKKMCKKPLLTKIIRKPDEHFVERISRWIGALCGLQTKSCLLYTSPSPRD